MADSRDITGKNRKFTGTTGVKLPEGTTAQRVDEAGQLRFNSDTNLAEYYDGTDWKSIDAPPTITGFTIDGGASVTSSPIDNAAGGDATIVISGSNFDTTSATVVFEPEAGGSDVTVQTITRTNSSSFTVTVTRSDFLEANDPYAIKLTNGSGLAATLASALDVNQAPTFATAADTNIGTVQNGDTSTEFDANLTTVAATDAEGDTITHTISAGSLPNGMSLETDGTFTGTCSSLPSSLTESTFTVQAATSQYTVTRQFKINGIDSAYVTATGGTVTESGDYKIHTFTSDGTFTVSSGGDPSGSTQVDYLVVAGGGGGANNRGGGGGAGGFRESHSDSVSGPYTASPLATPTGITVSASPGTYPISVGSAGAGAAPGAGSSAQGGTGNNSVFSTITSAGGGGGGGRDQIAGLPGGSGGGGGSTGPPPGTSGAKGTGNSPPVSPPQGNPGGGGRPSSGPLIGGSGGGGATAVGGTAPASYPHPAPSIAGGAGATTSISATPTAYAGGGGGGATYGSSGGPGGTGGGGRGGNDAQNGSAATNGLGGGGGGGGGGNLAGANGGSGIVIIRYKFQ
jgi:hypothetical protein